MEVRRTELLIEPGNLAGNCHRALLLDSPSCSDENAGRCSDNWMSASIPPAAKRVASESGIGSAAIALGTKLRFAIAVGV